MLSVEKHVNFITIREDFSEFEAENGQILKIKKVITDLIEQPVENNLFQAKVQMQDVIHVITTKKIDTDDMVTADLTSLTDKDIIENLSFKPKKIVLNIYETETFILLVDVQVTSIGATNKLDVTGNPYLRFRTNFGMNIILKPKSNAVGSRK